MRNGEEAALCVSVPPPFQGSINEGNRLNFEKFRWNFSSSTYPEIERSELYQVNVKLKLNVIFIVEKQCFV